MPGSFYRLLWCTTPTTRTLSARFRPAATDLNQGVVFGPVTPRTEHASRLIRGFDHEQVFAPRCTASA